MAIPVPIRPGKYERFGVILRRAEDQGGNEEDHQGDEQDAGHQGNPVGQEAGGADDVR